MEACEAVHPSLFLERAKKERDALQRIGISVSEHDLMIVVLNGMRLWKSTTIDFSDVVVDLEPHIIPLTTVASSSHALISLEEFTNKIKIVSETIAAKRRSL